MSHSLALSQSGLALVMQQACPVKGKSFTPYTAPQEALSAVSNGDTQNTTKMYFTQSLVTNTSIQE